MEIRKAKRGQITLFVILAIVVLLIVGFFIYLNYQNNISIVEGPDRTTVSEKFEPLQLFVEDCMESVARDAIVQLGKHGGYIDPNDAYMSGRVFYGNADDQSDSDMAYLSDDIDKAMPYWYYSYNYGDCTDCMMMSQAPYIDEMERQISIYVTENINICLDGFQNFLQQGYDLAVQDNMIVRTTIREEDVLVESIYTIGVVYDGSQATIENYVATVDIPLMKYYNMALNISKQEYESQFLEGLNAYLILSYSGLSPELLPPIYSYSSGYDMVFWAKGSVRENIKQLLQSYVPLMQVKGAKNYREVTGDLTDLEKNFVDLITLDMFPDRNLEKTEVSFIYIGDGISFDIHPSTNELLGPFKDTEEGVSVAPPKNTFSYQFFYDVSYPVIVEIKDEYKPGQYYTFMFALESTIKQNLPLREWWNASKRPLYFEHDFFDISFNDPLSGQTVTNPRTGQNYQYKERVRENVFCEPEQRMSGNVYLKTYDAATKDPLEKVDITFGCGNYASCNIGTTENDPILNVESFKGKFPVCMNGYVQLEKPGYAKKIMKLTTTPNGNVNLGSIYLEKIHKVNVTVKVYPMTRVTVGTVTSFLVFPNMSFPLGQNDTVFITLNRITTGLDEPLSQTVLISPTTRNTVIEITPGRYTMSGQLYDEEGYTIPKECDEVCDNYFAGVCTSYKDIPENDIPIKNAIMGGIEIDDTYPLNVKREHLTGNKTLEIYLIRMPSPPCINEMQDMGKTTDIVARYRSRVMPQFK